MGSSFDYDVIIAGGGPAGSSAAIHLAAAGARVLLAEQKEFPRAKLCGEFISPECVLHFEQLGVADRMLAAQPSSLTETVFFARNGRSVSVPSSWFGAHGIALGLSRAEMDERLLRRASEIGVDVLENAQAVNVILEDRCVRGAVVRSGKRETYYRAPVTIDATGRTRSLARHIEQKSASDPRRATLVAFKAHLENTRVANGACEIYFYRSGYGGLSTIENGLSNLCFIASADDVRKCGTDAERVMREVVCQNRRAADALKTARVSTPWLAVSLGGFGRRSVRPANGLLAIGDAASFIDPFTGSGMLMALETGELAAHAIVDRLDKVRNGREIGALGQQYRALYKQRFDLRLRLCSMMRRAAFVPSLAGFAIGCFRASRFLRRRITRATRFGLQTD